MKHLLIFVVVFFALLNTQAQDIKYMDYRDAYKRNSVAQVQSVEVRYRGNEAVDTLPVGVAEIDEKGRMIRYVEFFARGRKSAEYIYHYDAYGRIASAEIAHRALDFRPVPFVVEFDDKGRMVSRAPQETIPGFWEREEFMYSPDGTLVKAWQYYPTGQSSSSEYPASVLPKENSLSWIFDQKGLPVTQQVFDRSGKSERAILFRYKYR
jgi:hypothetical protein